LQLFVLVLYFQHRRCEIFVENIDAPALCRDAPRRVSTWAGGGQQIYFLQRYRNYVAFMQSLDDAKYWYWIPTNGLNLHDIDNRFV